MSHLCSEIVRAVHISLPHAMHEGSWADGMPDLSCLFLFSKGLNSG